MFQFFVYALPIRIRQVLILFLRILSCGKVGEHTWSFPKNTSISPIETSFDKVCLPTLPCVLWRAQNRHRYVAVSILYPS